MEYKNQGKFKVTLDLHSFKNKPTPNQTAHIIKRMSNNVRFNDIAELYPEELLFFCKEGLTVAPALFKKGSVLEGELISDEKWRSQQVFFIDIDERLPLHIAKKKFKEEGLHPNFWYYSKSNPDYTEDRYRLVYIFDKPINDKTKAKQVYNNLKALYPESDTTTSTLSNIFYGGYGGEIIRPTYTNVDNLDLFIKSNSEQFTYTSTSTIKARKKKKEKYAEISDDYKRQLKTAQKKAKGWKSKLNKNSKLFKAFDDEEYLEYIELRCLATSLIHLCGGYTYMVRRLKKLIGEDNRYKETDLNLVRELNKRKYKPEKLTKSKLRPQFHEDTNYYSIYHIYKFSSNTVRIIKNETDYVSIEFAENQLLEEFDLAMGNDKKINVIKAQTALGKSDMLLQKAPDHQPLVIAHKNHSLKSDVYNDFINSGFEDIIVTGRNPSFKQEGLNFKIKKAYELGLYSKASELIHSTANKINTSEENQSIEDLPDQNEFEEDAKTAHSYLENEDRIKQFPNIVVTTHSKLTHNTFISDNYIYDEDPLLNDIIKTGQIGIKDLLNLKWVVGKEHHDIYYYFRNLEDKTFQRTPKFEYYTNGVYNSYNQKLKEAKLSKMAPPVFALLESDMLYKENNSITFYTYNEPDPEKNITILSATAPINVYKALFPDRVQIYEIPKAKHKGTIKQFANYSYSKSSLRSLLAKDQNEKIINNLREPNWKTITVEEFKGVFPNADEKAHLFNCSGYNHLTGENINVVGTPHLPENIYKFIYFIITGETVEDEIMYRVVEKNGYKFEFPTYENELLRTIQLDLIESNLLQAIGRARTLRFDSEVHVYSNLITSLTDSIEDGIVLD